MACGSHYGCRPAHGAGSTLLTGWTRWLWTRIWPMTSQAGRLVPAQMRVRNSTVFPEVPSNHPFFKTSFGFHQTLPERNLRRGDIIRGRSSGERLINTTIRGTVRYLRRVPHRCTLGLATSRLSQPATGPHSAAPSVHPHLDFGSALVFA